MGTGLLAFGNSCTSACDWLPRCDECDAVCTGFSDWAGFSWWARTGSGTFSAAAGASAAGASAGTTGDGPDGGAAVGGSGLGATTGGATVGAVASGRDDPRRGSSQRYAPAARRPRAIATPICRARRSLGSENWTSG